MQSVAPKLKWLRGLLTAALYVSVFGCATPPPPAPVPAAPAPAPKAPASIAKITPPPVAQSAKVAEPAPVAVSTVTEGSMLPADRHIALILPLKSPAYGKSAEAVQQGFLAAATQQKDGLPVRIYPCNDEKLEVVALYQQAIQAGAVAVAGPLTRNGVTALATNPNLNVPTLALNLLDEQRTDQLYFFGLSPEAEARQVAQWATKVGLLSATVVRTNSYLSKRLAQAFSESWQRSGGVVQPEIVYAGDPDELRLLALDPGNLVFLAAEVDKARLMRPYINTALPVYATSQVFAGNGNNLVNYDLAEVRFIDMPWFLQPDHTAVMVYPRAVPALSRDMERLYALGIDAYRLLQVIYMQDLHDGLPLDGVTGKVRLNGNLFELESASAVMRQGQGLSLEGRAQPAESKPQQ